MRSSFRVFVSTFGVLRSPFLCSYWFGQVPQTERAVLALNSRGVPGRAHRAFDLRAPASPRRHVEPRDPQIDRRRAEEAAAVEEAEEPELEAVGRRPARPEHPGRQRRGRQPGAPGPPRPPPPPPGRRVVAPAAESTTPANTHGLWVVPSPRTQPITRLHLVRWRCRGLSNHNRRGRADEGDPAEHCKLHRCSPCPVPSRLPVLSCHRSIARHSLQV